MENTSKLVDGVVQNLKLIGFIKNMPHSGIFSRGAQFLNDRSIPILRATR